MNALAFSRSTAESPEQIHEQTIGRESFHPCDDETLTARQWSTLLGVTPKALHLRKVDVAGQRLVRGGLTKFFAFHALPEDYRSQLEEKRRTFKCLRFADLLDVQATATWQPEKSLTQLPEHTQGKAFKKKDALDVYFAAIGNGMTSRDAETKARSMWLQMTGQTISDRQVRRWVKSVEDRGGPELARIEAYADGKSVPHHNARLLNKKQVPDEFIRAFKSKCLEPGICMVTAAYRFFVIAWTNDQEVPGYGYRESAGQVFPLTIAQCRGFAPSRAAMIQAGRGKFAAKIEGALPTMVMTSAGLRLCERYISDDTRINIACLDDRTGLPVELKSYWCMEASCRKIVAWLVRIAGACRSSDVDALAAKVMRTSGIAAPGAGYHTEFLYEKGTVSCSPARKVYIESMFPGQVKVRWTGMIGGQNAPGDFVQENSGNFFGKGKVESFMRTLDYFCRHIKGQRGGTYRKQPAMLGSAGLDRKKNILRFSAGSQIDEAVLTAQVARALALIESKGTDQSPEARLACEAFNVKTPLYYMSEVLAAMELVVAYYNSRRGHRMEGFREIAIEKPGGGLTYVTESPNDKALRLELELEALGKSPMRISPADACALMLKAKKVICKPNGVTITMNRKRRRFWDPNSLAVAAVQRLATLEREYIALYDQDDPQEIYLLQNTAGNYPDRVVFDLKDQARFLESLPLAEASDETDQASMSRGYEQTRSNHNRVTREIVRDIAPYLNEHDQRRVNTASTVESLCRVMATHRAEQRKTNLPSALSDNVSEARSKRPAKTRAEQQPSAEKDFAAYLAGDSAEEE